jgi:hypothetical protein
MREENNQPKQTPQIEKEKRQQWKPWHRKGQHGKARKKDPEAIPILKYGPGNNFEKLKEVISKVALKEYGTLENSFVRAPFKSHPHPIRLHMDRSTHRST